MLISKKTHCFNCPEGELERSEITDRHSGKIVGVKYSCNSCEAKTEMPYRGVAVGCVEYYTKEKGYWTL